MNLHVKSAVLCDRRLDEIFHFLAVSNIGSYECRTPTTSDAHIMSLIVAFYSGRLLSIGAHDVRTFSRESKCNRSTNSRGSTRHAEYA